MATDTDRFVGIVTALILGVSGFGYLMSRLKKLQRGPDAYHRSRYVKHRLVRHQGSCSCSKINFTMQGPASIDALDCESKIRYPHVCIPPNALDVFSGQEYLGTYTTNSNGVKTVCLFCTYCGCHVYRLVNDVLCHVNVDLIDKATIEKLVVSYYDGLNMLPFSSNSYLNYSKNEFSNTTSQESSNYSSTSTPKKSDSNDKSTSPLIPTRSPTSKHSTTNNQSSHSTNILAVQIYGAFADLKKENTSNWKSISTKNTNQNETSRYDFDHHESHFNGGTPAEDDLTTSPSPSSSSPPPKPNSRNTSPNPSSSSVGRRVPTSRQTPQFSPPSLEQLRKLDSNKKKNNNV